MHPFNRQHNTRSRPKNTALDRHGRLSPEELTPEEEPLCTKFSLMRTPESSALPSRRSLPHDQDILRAKEKVLLSSLKQGYSFNDAGNSQRLGPNTQNIFHMFKNASDTCINQKVKQSYVGFKNAESCSNLLNPVGNITVNVEKCEEFSGDMFKKYSKTENEKVNWDFRVCCFPNNEDKEVGVLDDREENDDGKICGSHDTFDSMKRRSKDTIQFHGSCQEVKKTNSSETSYLNCEEDDEAETPTKEYNSTSNNPDQHHHQFAGNERDNENVSSSELNHNNVELTEFSCQFPLSPTEKLHSLPHTLLDYEEIASGKPVIITHNIAVSLKEVILGSASEMFSPQWMDQAFTFNTHYKLRYGFVQKRGGACGVLAAVQAHLLRTLLFEPGACSSTEPLRPTSAEVSAGLARAVSRVLWQAGEEKEAVLATPSHLVHLTDSGSFRRDGLTETLVLERFCSKASLEDAVRTHLDHFTSSNSSGCLLMVFSAVLSRGLSRLREDMDEPTALIGRNGHCVQELVNLVLTGRACSNVFDNTVRLDSCTLNGVHCRAEVGFLSLYEHYNSCQVGSYLKTPKFPVWVVCSDSHFTVLFSCRRDLVSDWRAEKRFNLYHYDSMTRHDDEVKLTVDTTGLVSKNESKDRTPLLEHCVRTKWKDAAVDWNGYQPSA